MEDFIKNFFNFSKTFDLGQFLLSIQWLLFLIYFIISFIFAIKTLNDSQNRFKDKFFIVILTVFVFMFNIFGYWVYLLFRPREHINDQHIQKLEKYLLEYEARGIGKCKVCQTVYYPEHMYCNSCGNLVKATCQKCDNVIELDWKVCPYCGDKKKINLNELKNTKDNSTNTISKDDKS
jgi:uncharacterized OB-fold protein